MCLKGMSPCDARGNVYHVLLAWLEGKGSPGKPRTWGTLLDAMRRAPQYLQELANRAEYILLGKKGTQYMYEAYLRLQVGAWSVNEICLHDNLLEISMLIYVLLAGWSSILSQLYCAPYCVALCRGAGISADELPCVCHLQKRDTARPK